MSFSEEIKLDVKKKAGFRCCMCEKIELIDVHHLVPESEKGPDIFDNAVPLCPNCHRIHGANPTIRKYLKQKRDWWYEQIERTDRIPDQLERIEKMITDFSKKNKLKIQKEGAGELR